MPKIAERSSRRTERPEGVGAAIDSRTHTEFMLHSSVRLERAGSARERIPPGYARPDSAAGAERATPRDGSAQRLLVPVDATERSRWPLRYALAHRGEPLHVDLLFVAEPVTSLEMLRFRTQADIAEFQAKMAHWVLEDAAKPLQAAGLSVRSHFREGDVVGKIVETAEQLGADVIVMPPPHPVWFNFLTRGIVRKVLRHARITPIMHVDQDGKPLQTTSMCPAKQST